MSWAFGYLIWSYLSRLVASLGFAGLFFKQLETKTHGGVGGNARGVYQIDCGFNSKNNHTMTMMRLSKKVRNLGAQQLKSSCYPLIQTCLLDLPGSERYVPRFLEHRRMVCHQMSTWAIVFCCPIHQLMVPVLAPSTKPSHLGSLGTRGELDLPWLKPPNAWKLVRSPLWVGTFRHF
jgi:hypothetical protein